MSETTRITEDIAVGSDPSCTMDLPVGIINGRDEVWLTIDEAKKLRKALKKAIKAAEKYNERGGE